MISLRGLWDTEQHTLILCFGLGDVAGVLQQHQLNKNCSGCNTLDGDTSLPSKPHVDRDAQHGDCKAVLHCQSLPFVVASAAQNECLEVFLKSEAKPDLFDLFQV